MTNPEKVECIGAIEFRDQHDPNCYLVVSCFSDGGVSIHGWNDNTDSFTGIDLSPSDTLALIAFLEKAVTGD